MASGPITSWQIDGETVADFIFWGFKITADGDWSSDVCSSDLSGSLLMSWLFTSGCQSIGVSASASVLPMNIQD